LGGDRAGVVGSIASLGDLELAAGGSAEALARYAGVVEEASELGEDYTFAYLLAGVAAAVGARGRRAEASRLWGAVERLETELATMIRPFDRARYLALLGDRDPAAEDEGRALSIAEAAALAAAL